MPEILSGPRQARSMVTPANAIVSRVLDFNFAADQGIEITRVVGSLSCVDLSPAASDTVPINLHVAQTLHLEEGTIETIPFGDGGDADEIDTEIFYDQDLVGQWQTGATNTFGAGGNAPSATFMMDYGSDPILVARNITHRGETGVAGQVGFCRVLIFYHYVRFSLRELGLILARRQ